MSKLHVLGMLAGLLWGLSVGATTRVTQESDFKYQAQKADENLIQMSAVFLPVGQASKIPSFVDPYALKNETEGIRNFVMVRSSFILNLSVDEIRKRSENPIELSSYSKKFKVKSCSGRVCDGTIVTPLANNDVTFEAEMIEKSDASFAEVFRALGNPEVLIAQKYTRIEMVFNVGSNFSALYKVSDDKTFVQNFQLFAIRESAYRVPFINLDKKIREVVQDMLVDGRASLLRENGRALASMRAPAASPYDQNLYKQKSFQLVDSAGDEALLARTHKVPRSILHKVFGKKTVQTSKTDAWVPEKWELEDPLETQATQSNVKPGISIQGRDNPLLVGNFVQVLNQVLLEERQQGLDIQVGKFHEWSEETRERYASDYLLKFSKLFISLTQGFTNWFMITGTEQELRDWMLAQQLNSITLHEMFRESLKLNRGDVYLSLLTIENVLSSNWRYEQRETLPTTRRLRSITSGYNYDAEKYGTWYHFIGMVLWGYYSGKGRTAEMIGKVEALGSDILAPKGTDQTQKQWFNFIGGYVGASLRRSVESGVYARSASHPEILTEEFYLNRGEDFRDRLPVLNSKDLIVHVQSDGSTMARVQLTNTGVELNNCQLDLILNQGLGYRSSDKIQTTLSLATHQSIVLNVAREKTYRGLRAFVHGCKSGDSRSVEVNLLKSNSN